MTTMPKDNDKLQELLNSMNAALETQKQVKKLYDEATIASQAAKKAYDDYLAQQSGCEKCRFKVILRSGVFDTSHYYCGHEGAPCICCHKTCRYFRLDNYVTERLKVEGILINEDDAEAIDSLYTDILGIDATIENISDEEMIVCDKIIDTLKIKYKR